MRARIYNNDVIEWSQAYEGDPFHALLCDPPYELGFMGQDWDKSGVAFQSRTWAALTKHLMPGAFGLAFASSRGYHRMAAAIEDAGLIIHPSIFGWAFGSGFPKATNIDRQVDEMLGAGREAVGKHPAPNRKQGGKTMGGGWQDDPDVTIPASEQAQAWEGHRYGLQAMKPALEPIVLFQKPYESKPVEDMLKHGAGALNIQDSRVGDEAVWTSGRDDGDEKPEHRKYGKFSGTVEPTENTGRWPANLVLQHHPYCLVGECRPDCPIVILGDQSGVSKSGGPSAKVASAKGGDSPNQVYGAESRPLGHYSAGYFDEGTAARFYLQYDWAFEVFEQLNQADQLLYTPKASRKEREAGIGHRPLAQVNDGRNKPIDNPYLRGETSRRNPHPTVKPIALTRWLAGLLLPPGLYAPRRLLVPFSGVGSEMIGAMLSGWDHATGIELDHDFLEIARERLGWWSTVSRQAGTDSVDDILEYALSPYRKTQEKPDYDDLPLFQRPSRGESQ